jgi:hypothetical protein
MRACASYGVHATGEAASDSLVKVKGPVIAAVQVAARMNPFTV